MTGSFVNGDTTLTNQGDLSYYCNLTVGGVEFTTLIDTGSSDLWVAGSVPGSKDLNIPATITYAVGHASGSINTAVLNFDDFTIPDQAYILVPPSADNPAGEGLIGLGPNSLSVVRHEVGTAAGNAPLDRIFLQNLTTPNILTVLLSRASDDGAGGGSTGNLGQGNGPKVRAVRDLGPGDGPTVQTGPKARAARDVDAGDGPIIQTGRKVRTVRGDGGGPIIQTGSGRRKVRTISKGGSGDGPIIGTGIKIRAVPNVETGEITVGEIVPGLESITSQAKLPALKDEYNIQHWQTLLDKDGIIGPDGQPISVKSTVSDVDQPDQLRVVFDTGFSLPQVTREVADAIYGRIPGAVFVPQSDAPGYWQFPCDYELNVTFKFSGVSYPINPLDLGIADPMSNSNICQATFQEIAPSVSNHQAFGAFDMILGMAFLRNTYLLINFGDFVDGSSASVADPYIQLLSITDMSVAHKDFVRVRLNGVDTTASQKALVPAGSGQMSPNDVLTTTPSNGAVQKVKKFLSRSVWIAIAVIGGALFILALLCGLCICLIRRRRTVSPTVPPMNAYKPLSDPSGYAAPEPTTHGVGYASYQPQYQQPPPGYGVGYTGSYNAPGYQYQGHA
ncbi:hypothetical protein BD410DRAFT_787244 [Rickenella mellea]|uniref:Peptidase A1 domain-containing protein n=1 Tax=Rickenella mellea TaxID=50990 RepID=A0A4Y7Q7L4_9AGAM|nr:hypothetical protein BD410DRAFT_787244 [Rickenella mellea]